MTALVFLEDNPDLSSDITIERSDVYAASTTYLRANEQIAGDELLHLLLIASDNGAARALARTSHGGTPQFVERMNEKAIELGLENTSFADPSGLNPDNVSSAFDLSRLILSRPATSASPRSCARRRTTVTTNRRTIRIHSTNHLLMSGDVDVMGGKTGFIGKAGYCLATLLRLPQGNPVAVVVLGAHSNTGRFWETRHLFNWLSEKTGTLLVKDDEIRRVQVQVPSRLFQVPDRSCRALSAPSPDRDRTLDEGLLTHLSVASLHRCGVERKCRNRVDRRHHGPRGIAPIECLQIPLADVAGVQPVQPVARGERRDPRAIGVTAERARELMEAPARDAAGAEQQALR